MLDSFDYCVRNTSKWLGYKTILSPPNFSKRFVSFFEYRYHSTTLLFNYSKPDCKNVTRIWHNYGIAHCIRLIYFFSVAVYLRLADCCGQMQKPLVLVCFFFTPQHYWNRLTVKLFFFDCRVTTLISSWPSFLFVSFALSLLLRFTLDVYSQYFILVNWPLFKCFLINGTKSISAYHNCY